MDKFTTLSGIAAPFPMINCDTDKIIPARFLKTLTRTGLGASLFYAMRFDAHSGEEIPEFVLNKPAWREAKILIAGENFGCGSSREHAPWALLDFGISCVIAPSFADIFYNNCFKNGMLPLRLADDVVDDLFGRVAGHAGYRLTVDLQQCTLADEHGLSLSFEVDPFRRQCLLGGLDDIGMTLEHEAKIDAYERAHGVASL